MAKHTDRTKRPKAVDPDYSVVPNEIRILRKWVMWRFDWIITEGNWAKVPYHPNGYKASTVAPDQWSTFESCLATFEQSKSKYDGIGFVFSKDDDYIGVDLDACVRDEEGEFSLTPFAQTAIEHLMTYTELSPSLTGLHFIGKSKVVEAVKTTFNKNQIEMYGTGRYFTFTGRSWQTTPLPITDIDKYAREILAVAKDKKTSTVITNAPQHSLDIKARLEMALKNPRTQKLFNGDISEYSNDDSVADMALCGFLAYYSDGRAEVLDAMFRQSKLMRPKWDEMRGFDTYGNITVKKVLATKRDYLSVKSSVKSTDSTYDSRKSRRFTMHDLWDKAMSYRHSGEAQGVSTGWKAMDEFYRPALRDMTVVTGIPGSGKSTWLDVMCYNIATQYKWQFTFASFETLPIERHILNLCQIHLAKPTFSFVKDATPATDAEMERARNEIGDLFHFIMPDENEMDMFSILKYVDDDIKDYGMTGFVLDPFTEIDQSRERNVSQKEYIRTILRHLQDFTRRRSIATWLVAHPTKPNGETYRNGRPTLYSIDGSADFFNKPDYGVIVHRSESDKTTVFIDKVRNDIVGKRGEVDFEFDKHKKLYTVLGGELPPYAVDNYVDTEDDLRFR